MALELANEQGIEFSRGAARRVLIVSYFFPPAADVGGQRTLRFVKHLPQFGWQPVVLTTANGRVSRLDESLLAELPPGLEVQRTHSFERLNYGIGLDGNQAAKANGLWLRLLREFPKDLWRLVAIPDEKLGWAPYAIRAGRRLMESRSIDAIYVSGKPFSSYFIGRSLSRRFGVPWIMDLRDLWVLNRRQRPRNRLAGHLESRLESSFVHSAARVIANTPDNRSDFLAAYPDCGPEKFVVITNGYDRDDFSSLPAEKPMKFTIGYAGVFYMPEEGRSSLYRKVMGLDGANSRKAAAFSPRPIFEALAKIVSRRPELRDRIEVVIAGPQRERIQPLAEQCGVADMVQHRGFLSYHESLKLIKSVHLLAIVLPSADANRGVVPCKLYQYLGSGNPVLALVPEGDARDIVEQTGAGVACPPDDVSAIERTILDFYERDKTGRACTRQPKWADIEKFESRHLTRRLAECLDAAVEFQAGMR